MESVFILNNDVYCRACTKLSSASDMINFFDQNKKIVAETYTQCTMLQVNEFDGLPKFICHMCHDQLLSLNAFRLSCIEADNFFRNKIIIKNEHCETELPSVHVSVLPEFVAVTANKPTLQFGKRKTCAKKNNSPKGARNRSTNSSLKIEPEKEEYPVMLEIGAPKCEVVDTNLFNTVELDVKSELFTNTNEIRIETNASEKNIPVKCDFCEKQFFKKHRLVAHMRAHQGLRPYECNQCGRGFLKLFTLNMHNEIHHSTETPKFQCGIDDCNRIYSRKSTLAIHMKKFHNYDNSVKGIVEERKFTCELCGKCFGKNSLLQKHLFTHTGESAFGCEICNKKYPTKYKLQIHTNRHNGIKNHVCSICGLRKATGHELKVHMNYHTREKLFVCKFCGREYPNAGNMNTHIKVVHIGVKPYKCQYCERTFAKAGTLKHHVMTHTGVKPHECKICGKSFIQLTALHTHTKTHRK